MKEKILMLVKIVQEYGIEWCFNRALYVLKLKLLRANKKNWKLFEHKESIFRMNIFDVNVQELDLFYTNLDKGYIDKLISSADEAINGKIVAFNKEKLNYKKPIKFNYNPITDKYVDNNKKWFDIPDFNDDIGDIKLIWEPSRFCYIYLYSKAYIITKNIKYYEAFSRDVEEWLNQNVYPNGANYKCGQESAIRMVNLLMNYSIFERYGLITKDDAENVKQIIKGSYKKLLSNFFYAEKCIKNNHTLSELMGLMVGAWCENNKKKIKIYYKKFNEQIKKQFFDDGGYMQYSFNYQRLSLQWVELLYKIKDKLCVNIGDNISKRIKESVEQLYNLQEDDNSIPNYGANDGALIFPFSCCDYRNFSSTLNTLNIFITKERLYDKYIYEEEAIWFGLYNSSEYNIQEKLRSTVSYSKSGLYSLRNNNMYLMLVCNDYKSRPSHLDNMHMDLWMNGKNILCDSGSYSYANGYDKKYAVEEAHNIVKVEGMNQLKKSGNFLTYNWPKAKILNFNNNVFEGMMISDGYSHVRKVSMKDDRICVNDSIKVKSFKENKKCKLIFNTPYSAELYNGKVKIIDDNNQKYIISFNEANLKVRFEEARISLYYYNNIASNRIFIEKELKNGECNFSYEIMEEK